MTEPSNRLIGAPSPNLPPSRWPDHAQNRPEYDGGSSMMKEINISPNDAGTRVRLMLSPPEKVDDKNNLKSNGKALSDRTDPAAGTIPITPSTTALDPKSQPYVPPKPKLDVYQFMTPEERASWPPPLPPRHQPKPSAPAAIHTFMKAVNEQLAMERAHNARVVGLTPSPQVSEESDFEFDIDEDEFDLTDLLVENRNLQVEHQRLQSQMADLEKEQAALKAALPRARFDASQPLPTVAALRAAAMPSHFHTWLPILATETTMIQLCRCGEFSLNTTLPSTFEGVAILHFKVIATLGKPNTKCVAFLDLYPDAGVLVNGAPSLKLIGGCAPAFADEFFKQRDGGHASILTCVCTFRFSRTLDAFGLTLRTLTNCKNGLHVSPPWHSAGPDMSSAVKAGSFNPYGNGQPRNSKPQGAARVKRKRDASKGKQKEREAHRAMESAWKTIHGPTESPPDEVQWPTPVVAQATKQQWKPASPALPNFLDAVSSPALPVEPKVEPVEQKPRLPEPSGSWRPPPRGGSVAPLLVIFITLAAILTGAMALDHEDMRQSVFTKRWYEMSPTDLWFIHVESHGGVYGKLHDLWERFKRTTFQDLVPIDDDPMVSRAHLVAVTNRLHTFASYFSIELAHAYREGMMESIDAAYPVPPPPHEPTLVEMWPIFTLWLSEIWFPVALSVFIFAVAYRLSVLNNLRRGFRRDVMPAGSITDVARAYFNNHVYMAIVVLCVSCFLKGGTFTLPLFGWPAIFSCFSLIHIVGEMGPAYAIVAEEFIPAMYPDAGGLRLSVGLVELIYKMAANPRAVRSNLTVCFFHLVWTWMGIFSVPAAFLMHATYNLYFVPLLIVKRTNRLIAGARIACNDNTRTYDMAVGRADYRAEPTHAFFHRHVQSYWEVPDCFSGWDFSWLHPAMGLMPTRIYLEDYTHIIEKAACVNLYEHLHSIRASCSARDAPELIRSRVENLARSFTSLDHDRSSLVDHWPMNTVELAIADIVDAVDSFGNLSSEPLFLRGYMMEAILGRLPAVTQCEFDVRSAPYHVEPRCGVQIAPIPDAIPPKPSPSDVLSTIAGTLKRLCIRMPPIDRHLAAEFKEFATKWVQREFQPLPADADLSVPTWLANSPYAGSRREELLRVWLAQPNWIKKHKVCKAFVKDEHLTDYKYPRIISSRQDRWKCHVGPVLKLLEKIVFQHPAFIKKVPLPDRPAYILAMLGRLQGEFLETDFTSFEATFTPEFTRMTAEILYEHLASANPEALKVVRDHIKARTETQRLFFKRFSAKLRVARENSGEMDTSLNNGFANMILMLFVVSRRAAKAGIEFDPHKPIGVFEGDDGLTRLVRELIPTEADFRECGATCKLEVRKDITSSGFCGIKADDIDLAPLTDIREAFGTFGFTHSADSNAGPRRRRMLLIAKSLSYVYQYRGCPVLDPMANAQLTRYGTGRDVLKFITENRTFDQWTREHMIAAYHFHATHPPAVIGIRSRLLIEREYGVTVSEQHRLEAILTSADPPRVIPVAYDVPQSWRHYFTWYVDGSGRAPNRPATLNGRYSASLCASLHALLGPAQDDVPTQTVHSGRTARGLTDPRVVYVIFIIVFLTLFLSCQNCAVESQPKTSAYEVPQETYRPHRLMNAKKPSQLDGPKGDARPVAATRAQRARRAVQPVSRNARRSQQSDPASHPLAVAARVAAKTEILRKLLASPARSLPQRPVRRVQAPRTKGPSTPGATSNGQAGRRVPGQVDPGRDQVRTPGFRNVNGVVRRLPGGGLVSPPMLERAPPVVKALTSLDSTGQPYHCGTVTQVVGPGPVVGLANASDALHVGAGAHTEYVHTDARGAVVRAIGHSFLFTLSSLAAGNTAGDRMALQVVSPAALGGRLSVLAELFEQSRVRQARLRYVPAVSTLTPGEILMFCRNDLEMWTTRRGKTNQIQASNYPSAVAGPVREPLTLNIDPSTIIKKYLNPTSNDAAITTEGIVEVITMVDIAAGAGSLGSVFIEYDIDFFSQFIQSELVGVGSCTATFTQTAVTLAQGAAYLINCGAAAANTNNVVFNPNNPDTIGLNGGCIAYGVVTSITGALSPNLAITPEEGSFLINVGTGLWFRFSDPGVTNNFQNSTITAFLYPDYASAQEFDTTPTVAVALAAATYSFTMSLNFFQTTV